MEILKKLTGKGKKMKAVWTGLLVLVALSVTGCCMLGHVLLPGGSCGGHQHEQKTDTTQTATQEPVSTGHDAH